MQYDSALFMINLIDDILDLSRIAFDKFEKQLDWFSIGNVLDEVIAIV